MAMSGWYSLPKEIRESIFSYKNLLEAHDVNMDMLELALKRNFELESDSHAAHLILSSLPVSSDFQKLRNLKCKWLAQWEITRAIRSELFWTKDCLNAFTFQCLSTGPLVRYPKEEEEKQKGLSVYHRVRAKEVQGM